jgi:hypothetical protein
MRVLLLSRNRVVQELVKLGSGGVDGIELEIASLPSEVLRDRYDLLLLDGRYLREEGPKIWEHLMVGQTVLLGDPREQELAEHFDTVLTKPFLPGDIRTILEEHSVAEAEADEERDTLSEFLEETLEREEAESEVLDAEELRRIRRLLNEEEPETDISEVSTSGSAGLDIDEFLELLEGTKMKKLRKLLRGARIHVTIEFPEEG